MFLNFGRLIILSKSIMKKVALVIYLTTILISIGFCQELTESNRFTIDEKTSLLYHREIDSLYLVGDYNEAIERVLILLDYYSQQNDVRGQIKCNNYLGDLLRASGEGENGLEYLNYAMILNRETPDSLLLAKTYNLLAAIYYEYNFPTLLDSATYYAAISADIARRHGDNQILYSDLNILGKIEEGLGNQEYALEYLYEALEIVRKVKSIDESLVLSNIAEVYWKLGKLKEAERLALNAFNQAKKDNIMVYIRLSSLLLEKIYKLTGNYKQAHFFMEQFHFATRNYLNEKTEKRINALKAHIEQTHNEIKLQKEIEVGQLYTIFLAVIIGFALIFIIIFYFQKRKMKAIIEELTQANIEIVNQKEEMEKVAKDLDTSNATLKKFITIMAHDLKSPFNAIIGFSDLLKSEYDNLSNDERKLAIENTYKSSVNALTLLEHLLEWARLQTGRIQMNIEKIDLLDVVEEIVSFKQPSVFLKKQRIENKVSKGLYIKMDRNVILTIFRNLLSNAIKFTPEGGEIRINASEAESTVTLIITDTGVGISPENIDKLFRIDEQFNTRGTKGEKGTGIGLFLCQEYIDKSGGVISVVSKLNEGTTFTLNLPKD